MGIKKPRLSAQQVIGDAFFLLFRLGEKMDTNYVSKEGLYPSTVYGGEPLTIKYDGDWIEISVQPYGVVFECYAAGIQLWGKLPYRFNYGRWVDDLHVLAEELSNREKAAKEILHADLPDMED